MSLTGRTVTARYLAVFVILLAFILTSSQQALAESRVVKDTRADTYRPVGPTGEHIVVKPGANGDITSVRTTHGVKAVNVVIRARELRGRFKLVGIDLVTSAKRHHRFAVTARAIDGHKDVSLTQGLNKGIRCTGLRVRVSTSRATIRFHIPRSCIGNPRWVRTGVVLLRSSDDYAQHLTVDVAGRKVLTDRWWNSPNLRLPHGPRVHVG